ncbi:hypothetical protein [Sphingomonas bacterium]|uniref:hypothetical protein n=1 Tax=Sphingomonas bacterium TaxID=1895847 RepID=UPI0015777307|nr:hypothetical protein [Sphingomonas bacterium]
MTTSERVLDLVYDAVVVIGEAKGRVFRPGKLPTQQDAYPQIKVQLAGESRQSLGRGSVQFTTTATIRVTAEVSAPVKAADPQSSEVELQLWAMKRQIELAVIGSYPLFREIQQLASVQAQLAYDAQATMLGGVQIDLAFEFYEGPEDFAPLDAVELVGVDAHLPAAGPGFSARLGF